jgi:hypothetical protein
MGIVCTMAEQVSDTHDDPENVSRARKEQAVKEEPTHLCPWARLESYLQLVGRVSMEDLLAPRIAEHIVVLLRD